MSKGMESKQVILSGIEYRDILADLRRIISEEVSKTPERPAEKSIITIDEAAELLDLSKGSIYRLTSTKSIPFIKKGGILRFERAALLKWLKEESVKTATA